jgi:hypothetical protein
MGQDNRYATVKTKIKREEYQLIKEKGYAIAELIRTGLQAKEIQESFASFALKVAEKLENTAKLFETITQTHVRLINEQQSIVASLSSLIVRLDLIAASLNNAVNRFDKLLEEQKQLINRMDSLIDKVEEKFNNLIDKVDKLIETRAFELERKLEDMAKRLNLSFRVIDKLVPEQKAMELKEAIIRKDENKVNEILGVQ